MYVHVDDDQTVARERIAAALARHYGGPGLDAVAVAGPPETSAEGLRKVIDAGAELILLNSLVDDAQQLERLVAEVIPHLRGAEALEFASATASHMLRCREPHESTAAHP